MENVMEELKKLVTKELEKMIEKGTMSPTELKVAMDAVCLIEKIDHVEYMENYEDEGYSGEDWSRGHNSSYMRGRSPSTGRYMSRGGSYDMERSGHSIKDRVIDKLERMMDESSSDYERQTIRNYINDLRG